MGYIEGDYYFIRRHYSGQESLVRLDDKNTDLLHRHPEIADRMRRRATSIYRTTFEEIHKPIGNPNRSRPHTLVKR